MPNAFVIAIDGLRASALGAYGNAWHGTPALDALASQSLIHDWMWCTSTKLEDFYGAVWRGDPPLLRSLADAGVSASLTTDEPALSDAPSADFAEVCRLDADAGELAPTIADTALARLFAVAAQQLQAAGETAGRQPAVAAPRLWWLHARGFYAPWDAPLELRQSLLEDEDPDAPTFVVPPPLSTAPDHDELLLDRVAYAAQTMVLDECVGGLLAALAESGLDEDTLVALVGCRGYALGEHGGIGASGLYGETLHVPCLLRVPRTTSPPPRSTDLVQPDDLFATLVNWFGAERFAKSASDHNLLAGADAPASAREFVIARGANGERAIRTPAWMLRQPPQHDATSPSLGVELYAKPDDRWEANEVASRCPDVATRLLSALESCQSAAANGSSVPPLDRDLVAQAF